MSQLIDGRSLALAIRNTLPARIKALPRAPGIGVILVGNDRASELYVKLKRRAAEQAGILFLLQRFAASSAKDAIFKCIDDWNADPRIDAMIVQLPLPKHLDERIIVERIDPEKDVDGFHPVNTSRYLNGERINPPGLIEGILRLLEATNIDIDGKQSVIIARESVFSKCLEHAFAVNGVRSHTVPPDGTHHNATVEADIVVVAAGRPKLMVGEDVKSGVIVIDVGINTLPNGTVVGDVDAETVTAKAAWLSPVPGGVGPMTIAMLLENVARLAEKNQS